MSEYINNASRRKEALKEVIKKLHQGQTVESLTEEFAEIIEHATAADIAEAEREMIAEGTPVQDIQQLCDLHVAVFRSGLENEPSPESLPGHPVYDFRMENEVIGRFLEALENMVRNVQKGNQEALKNLRNNLANFKLVEQHYDKKENLFFPYLENKGFEGPSSVMWGVDNEIRARIKKFIELVLTNPVHAKEMAGEFDHLESAIRDMIYKEEKILIPESLNRLSQQEWHVIRAELDQMDARPQAQPDLKVTTTPLEVEEGIDQAGMLPLDTGSLTLDQVNLMLKNLPVDITFVDENDEVRFFSQTKERIFTRTAAIIGRKVQKCHPPQSVHIVQKILDDFHAGKRDVSEFWIQMGGKFVHIRYFALRDENGTYRGTIEVTQDVAEIRALEGEKRLED